MISVAFKCKVCGKPGVLQLESSGNPEVDKYIASLAAHSNHNECVPEEQRIRRTRFVKVEPKSKRQRAPLPYADDERDLDAENL